MSAKIIDEKKITQSIKIELTQQVNLLTNKIKPGLAVIILGNNSASKVYVNNKKKACKEIGINSFVY